MSRASESEFVCADEIGGFSNATVAKSIPKTIIKVHFEFIFSENCNSQLIVLPPQQNLWVVSGSGRSPGPRYSAISRARKRFASVRGPLRA